MVKKKAPRIELNQIDNRIIMVGPLFQGSFGLDWFVQADHIDPMTRKQVVYTADGPFTDVREAIANAHEQAVELGWLPGSYMVSVDE